MKSASVAQTQTAGLWASVWVLLRMRVQLTWSNFRRAKPRQKIAQVIFILFIAAIATGGFAFSQVLIRFLRSPALSAEINLTNLFNALPGLVLSLAFLLILVTNFGVLLQALYLSRDMDFLISAPLPMRAVFLSKLIQAILPGFGLFCLFGIPLLFGLGSASNYTFVFYPMVLIVLAFLALAAAGIASILVMVVVRVAPARRIAEVLGFLGAIISILISQMGNLMGSMNINKDQFSGTVNQFASLAPNWSPFTFAGRGLTDLGSGDWLSGTAITILTLLVTGLIFTGTLSLAERLYYTGWAGMQSSIRKKKVNKKRTSQYRRSSSPISFIPAPMRGIFTKDILLIRRDLRNLSQLITPLILGFVMIITSSRSVGDSQFFAELSIQSLPVYTSILFTLFVGWMLMFNLASTSISREGKNYWLLNAAPIPPTYLIRAKYYVSFLPTLAVGWFFLVITAVIRSISLPDLGYILLVTGLSLAGLNGILLAFGISGANMDWEDPRKIGLRGGIGCLTLIVNLIYFGACLLLFLGPAVLWEIFPLGNLWVGRIVGLIFGIIFTLLCAILPLAAVRKRVPLLGQPKE